MSKAEGRFILCNFCTPKPHRWFVPSDMNSDQAMVWFHEEHLPTHVEELVEWVATQVPRCRTCERVIRNDAPVHRPCFDPDCACSCSYPALSERTTADAE